MCFINEQFDQYMVRSIVTDEANEQVDHLFKKLSVSIQGVRVQRQSGDVRQGEVCSKKSSDTNNGL